MSLTDIAIRNAKPRARPYKLGDSFGLFLLVQPLGSKLWRFKYRVDGREKKLSCGIYPEVSLSDARRKRDDARALLESDKDPSLEKRRSKARRRINANTTFAAISAELCVRKRADGWAPSTAKRSEYLLSLLDGPIGQIPIADIEPMDVLTAVQRIEARGNLESARRTLQLAGLVFRHAIATARLRSDPTRDLRGALANPKVTHYGAITQAGKAGELLRALEGYDGHMGTKLALQLAPHVFVRPGELRQAEWCEFDIEARVWSIPASKMKAGKEHHVPLSSQVVALLETAAKHSGPTGYVFPSIRSADRPMSSNTINASLRRLGYTSDQMTGHGFRAMASTLLNESGKWNPDAIERALAHGDSDRIRAAYHRGQYWDERVKMAQWWSDYLDQLREGAAILPFPNRETG